MKVLTLATGISIPERCLRLQRGFTLWEILVVVLIVLVTVSAIVSSTSLGRGDARLKLLGNDLGKLIHVMYQEAIFESRNYAISLNQKGFSVLEYNGEDWILSEQNFFKKIKIGEAQESSLVIDNLSVSAVEEGSNVPHILILSSGEMSAFEWQITDTELNSQIIIQGNLLGKVGVIGPFSLTDV